MSGFRRLLVSIVLSSAFAALPLRAADTPQAASQSCFLLYEVGVGELRRDPAQACTQRYSPASTFKVAHALFALDAGVVSGPDERMAFDGQGDWPASSRRDHDLASAMRNSVVWYFQRIAERLGAQRETDYLRKIHYGNEDASGALTRFWLGDSLTISPQEQQRFLLDLYAGRLPLSKRAVAQVKAMLVQPQGRVVNAMGEHAFAAPWPAGTVLSAKTGSTSDRERRGVRWLIGHVQRGRRSYVFVSCVVGARDLDANAAIDLAARGLHDAKVL
ncbi:hypothetical protein ASD78_00425 [Lysobacter sp. Root667]|uniref:penicillin-binding transpeptidase domain-containing protein n=1 Tax=Lysobacter sp. Root667 TaxID=1736581 RepID=UPI00070027E1|nr:penicillin-binding transpeptidase domain-containing protein [Lysobacter sp. Root667]KRA81780.1 hypothetical protein ASD78_00425 [Lysobacter sp. Root667]